MGEREGREIQLPIEKRSGNGLRAARDVFFGSLKGSLLSFFLLGLDDHDGPPADIFHPRYNGKTPITEITREESPEMCPEPIDDTVVTYVDPTIHLHPLTKHLYEQEQAHTNEKAENFLRLYEEGKLSPSLQTEIENFRDEFFRIARMTYGQVLQMPNWSSVIPQVEKNCTRVPFNPYSSTTEPEKYKEYLQQSYELVLEKLFLSHVYQLGEQVSVSESDQMPEIRYEFEKRKTDLLLEGLVIDEMFFSLLEARGYSVKETSRADVYASNEYFLASHKQMQELIVSLSFEDKVDVYQFINEYAEIEMEVNQLVILFLNQHADTHLSPRYVRDKIIKVFAGFTVIKDQQIILGHLKERILNNNQFDLDAWLEIDYDQVIPVRTKSGVEKNSVAKMRAVNEVIFNIKTLFNNVSTGN